MPLPAALPFGPLLKLLRKRAGMTQNDLAAALGYSASLICSLEKAQRQPDLLAVTHRFGPALGLQDDPETVACLIEQAALTRGERPPASVTLQRTTQFSLQEDRAGEQLPSPPTELLGHSGRLLTLVGPPGIGKTSLALAVAAQSKHHYPDGAVFVPLAEVNNPMLMASTILAKVGAGEASPKPPQTRLIEFLRRKTMLLVLDNCEQIREAASMVGELLSTCAGLVVLATSRERLHLRAEQRYRVPPLELAPAVELFAQRAVAVDAGFVLTAANRPTVETICQRLDCLPLAIELCAAQIDLMSPPQLLAYLHDRRLDLLVEGAHDLPPRQRTLRTAIEHSYQLLTEEQRALFRRLGVFAGGFALPELAEVSLDSLGDGKHDGIPQDVFASPARLLATLHALISKSLVRAETLPSGEQRFLLLETIREFALEQLRVHGEETLLRERHYAAYLQLFRTGDSHLRRPEAATWLTRLQPEQDNLRAALQWALDERCYAEAAWLLLAAWWFCFHIGRWYELSRWIAQLLPHRDALAPNLRLATLIAFWGVARASEESRPMNGYIDEMRALLKVCPEQILHSAFWFFATLYSTDLAEASAAGERSVACARAAYNEPELGPKFGVAGDRDYILCVHLWAYADRLLDYGEFARATSLLSESAQVSQTLGSRYEMAMILGIAGRLALLLGDMPKAHSLLHEAVSHDREFNYQEMVGHIQPHLGLITLYEGDTAEARRLLNDSLRLCLDLNDKTFLARVCTYLAETALWEGELDEAELWLARSLDYDSDLHLVRMIQVERLIVAARLAVAQGAHMCAATLFGVAKAVRSQLHYEPAGPLRALADAALATVHESLDPALFAEAFIRGQQLSLAEAYATMLASRSALTLTHI